MREQHPFIKPGQIWVHGGPENLQGDKLRRHARCGMDHCGLYFCREEDPAGLAYALGYATGALYRAEIALTEDEIFDLSNHEHTERVLGVRGEDFDGRDFLREAHRDSVDEHLGWANIDEEALKAAGFRGAIVAERPSGVMAEAPVLSLAVFDPAVITLRGSVRGKELAELRQHALAHPDLLQPLSREASQEIAHQASLESPSVR